MNVEQSIAKDLLEIEAVFLNQVILLHGQVESKAQFTVITESR